MSEMSREEAHKILDIFLDKQVDLERTIHHSTYSDVEIWSAVKRAYDDMEKLQKIEEILEKEYKLAEKEKRRCIKENQLQFDYANGYAVGIYNAIYFVRGEL